MGAKPVTRVPDVLLLSLVVVVTVVWTLVFGGLAVYWGVRWLTFDEPHVWVICTEGTSWCLSEGKIRTYFIVSACVWLYPFAGVGAAVLGTRHDARQERRSRTVRPEDRSCSHRG